MLRYTVYFVYIDHHSDEAAPLEQMIVEADSMQDASRKFYQDNDMTGCYIREIVSLAW
jgi:hypothetical protein